MYICWLLGGPGNQIFIGILPATGGVWVIIGYRLMMKGVMGQQNSYQAISSVHSTTHLNVMRPNFVYMYMYAVYIRGLCKFTLDLLCLKASGSVI